jgi:hypothetical protein
LPTLRLCAQGNLQNFAAKALFRYIRERHSSRVTYYSQPRVSSRAQV